MGRWLLRYGAMRSSVLRHNGTAVTELVYRHQLRPVIEHGAEAMDRIFAS